MIRIFLKQRFSSLFIVLKYILGYFRYLDVKLSALNNKINHQISKSNDNSPVLYATALGGEIGALRFEALLGLSQQGFWGNRPLEFLLCKRGMSACQMFKYNSIGNDINWIINEKNKKLKKLMCLDCFNHGFSSLSKIGKVNVIEPSKKGGYYSNKIDISLYNISELQDIVIESIPFGEQAMAGALRYFCIGNLENTSEHYEVLKLFFQSALDYADYLHELLERKCFSRIVCHHGVYIPHGITVAIAKKFKIPVTVWNLSYRKGTFMLSEGDTYHRTMLTNQEWQNIKFTKKEENEIINYLKTRVSGSNDWLSFQKRDNFIKDISHLYKKKYDGTITLLTNVIWDAQLHFRENIFKNMMEWIFETIEWAQKNQNYLILIRVHPAENRGVLPSRQCVIPEIKKKYNNIPENIVLLDSEHKISSYDCSTFTDITVIYGTKMGVEISSIGKPVIVVGDAWVRNKGFTYDPKSKNEYFDLLKNSNKLKMSNKQKFQALKYAYWFFFINCIDVSSLLYTGKYPPYRLSPTKNIFSYKNDIGLKKIFKKFIH